MKSYVTTKIVLAEPAPPPGKMVEKGIEPHTPGYTVVYPDGYESWCPKDTFERTSREVIATEKSLIFSEDRPVEEVGEPVDEEDPEFAEVKDD